MVASGLTAPIASSYQQSVLVATDSATTCQEITPQSQASIAFSVIAEISVSSLTADQFSTITNLPTLTEVTSSTLPLSIPTSKLVYPDIDVFCSANNVVMSTTATLPMQVFAYRASIEKSVQLNTLGEVKTCSPGGTDAVSYSLLLANGSALPGWITYNSSGYFRALASAPLGTLRIIVTGTLRNGQTNYFTLSITGVNDNPILASTPVAQTIPLGSTQTYQLPTASDLENNPFTYAAFETGKTSLPSWVAFEGASRTFTFSPTLYSQVGTVTISVTLTDAYGASTYSFSATVTNSAPAFASGFVPQSFSYSSPSLSYSLPTVVDNEILDYSIAITWNGAYTLPTFISYSAGTLTFSPTSASQVGSYSISVTLTDGEPKSNVYTLTVTVTNSPPAFITSLTNQIVPLSNSQVTYTFPDYSDPDGCSVALSMTQTVMTTLPTFITLVGNSTIIAPGNLQFSRLGVFQMSVTLTDCTGLTSQSALTIQITNTAPYFTRPLTDQQAPLNSVTTYSLPAYQDDEGQQVTITILKSGFTAIPSFMSFSNDVLTISPIQFGDLGTVALVVTVSDGQPLRTNYSLSVTVSNTAPYFMTSLTSSATVMLGDTLNFRLPSSQDDEGHTIQVVVQNQPTYIGINGLASLRIKPRLDADVGSSTVVFSLTDGNLSTTYSFLLSIIDNQYPQFDSSPITSFVMMVNSTYNYAIPSYSDPEGRQVSVSYNFGALPGSGTQTDFTITQPSFANVGTQSILVRLSDGFRLTNYTISVTVTNSAPYFLIQPENKVFQMNISETFPLPIPYDNEGNPISVVVLSNPSFITYTDPFMFTAYATSFSELTTSQVVFQLSDTHMSTTYSFLVTIYNTAPSFTTSPDPTMTVRYFNPFDLALPPVTDDQNNPVILTVTSNLTRPDAQLLKLRQLDSVNWILTILPQNYDYVRVPTLVTITVSDSNLATSYSFVLYVFNDAPIFTNGVGLQNVTQKMNDNLYYPWPSYVDPEGDNSTMNVWIVKADGSYVKQEDFITIDNLGIFIEATLFSQVGVRTFVIAIVDGQPIETRYTLRVTITNSAPYFIRNPSGKLGTVRVRLGAMNDWNLPPFKDEESNPVLIEQTFPPGDFVKFDQMRYTFEPKEIDQIKEFKIQGYIKDGGGLASPFSFVLVVYNDPPYFASPLPSQIVAQLHQTSFYVLPEVKDQEGLSTSVTVSAVTIWPAFVTVQKNSTIYTIMMSPEKDSDIGDVQLVVTVQDQGRAQRMYNLKIVVKDPGAQAANLLLNGGQSQGSKSTRNQAATKLGLKATSMSKLGVLKVKITNSQGLETARLNSTSFIINVVNKEQGVPFVLTAYENYILTFKVAFSDISKISNTIDADLIEVVVTDTLRFTGNPLQNFTLQKGTTTQIEIPPQMSEQTAFIADKIRDSANIVSVAAVPGGLVINMTLSLMIQYLWSLLNDLSFLTSLTLISITVPGIAQIIQSAMLSFIYLDVLQTDKWLTPLIIPKKADDDQTALNEQFKQNGFSDMMLVSNLGSTFVYLLLLLFMHGLLMISTLFANFGRMQRLSAWLKEKLVWNFTLRFFLQQFPPLMISSLINLYKFEFGSPGEAFSTGLSVAIIAVTQVMIASLLGILRSRSQSYKNQAFQERFGTLFQGINQQRAAGRYWQVLIMIRWSLTSVIVVCMRDFYQLQIMALLLISYLYQAILCLGQPWESRVDNSISVFNEIMVSCYLYVLIMLTEFNGTSLALSRDQMGTMLVVIIAVSSIVNFVKFFYMLSVVLGAKINLMLARRQRIYAAKAVKIQQKSPNKARQFQGLDDFSGDAYNFEESYVEEQPATSKSIVTDIMQRASALNQWRQRSQPLYEEGFRTNDGQATTQQRTPKPTKPEKQVSFPSKVQHIEPINTFSRFIRHTDYTIAKIQERKVAFEELQAQNQALFSQIQKKRPF